MRDRHIELGQQRKHHARGARREIVELIPRERAHDARQKQGRDEGCIRKRGQYKRLEPGSQLACIDWLLARGAKRQAREGVPETYNNLPTPPRPLDDATVVHQYGGKERLGGVRKAGALPEQAAPELAVGP